MDKLELRGKSLDCVFNSRCVCVYLLVYAKQKQKQAVLKLKTHLKQLLGCLQLALVLPGVYYDLYGNI